MYEIIAKGILAAAVGVWVLVLLHDVGRAAVGFVFDEPCPKKFLVNRIAGDTDTGVNWCFWSTIYLCSAAVGAAIWPLTIVILSVLAILLLLRKAVRASKSALAKHVEDLHKEK